MKKNSKLIVLLSSLLLLSFLCVGCGKQNTISEQPSLEAEGESITFEDSSETSITEDESAENETTLEDNEEADADGLVIPDYDYDEYLTISADDNTPILGYNIPNGWSKSADSKGKWATIVKTQIVEQDFRIMYNSMSSIMLNKIESTSNTEFNATEHNSVETPIGSFRVFTLDYIADNHLDAQYAIMPVTEEEGVTVSFSYGEGLPNFYEGTIDILLAELFGEKQPPIEIPDNYQNYLQSHDGINILGANPPAGYKYSGYYTGTSEYETVLTFSSEDPHNSSSISIMEYDTLASVYTGTKDVLTMGWVPDTNEVASYIYYTEKGTLETPYGTAKLYEEKTEYNAAMNAPYPICYSEIALLRLNGSYIYITYNSGTLDTPSDDIETILSQLF